MIVRPESAREAAAHLRDAAAAGRLVRPRGGGTKWGWGGPAAAPDEVLSTGRLNRIVEHNAGDLTAVLEAGVRLEDAQAAFAEAGQMLALDPPLGAEDDATVGGVVATADSGPLRHRYGAVRDLLLGATVALSDGTVARSGGKVIKNVAGYDLAKLFAGSFGTLGTITEVVVRLHPRPPRTATVVGRADDPAEVARAALALAQAPLELEALDVRWERGTGALLARLAGVAAGERAARMAEIASTAGLATTVAEDPAGASNSLLLDASEATLWEEQRDRQRSADAIVVRVSGLPTQLADVLVATARVGGSLVGRAGLGLFWITVGRADAVDALRRALAPSPCVVLDAPPEARPELQAWPAPDPPLLHLSRRVKERFDPAGICSPGVLP